jgi:hypothetical protein
MNLKALTAGLRGKIPFRIKQEGLPFTKQPFKINVETNRLFDNHFVSGFLITDS